MANNVIKRVWNQNKMVAIEDLKGMTFQNESGGHTFQISGVDDAGNAVALSGSVAGVFLRPDNTDVAITGSASGGVVSVTLLPECYDVPGRFGLTVFVTDNGQKTAVYAAIGTVSRTSSGAVSPGTTSDVVDLINQINAAVATIPASWTGLMADIAPTYSASAVYPVGAYCYYNGDLYRCTTAITTAESWTAGHWTPAVLGQDVSDLKQAISEETRNLWQNGNIEITAGGDRDGYTQFVLKKPIPAGTYKISGIASSSNTNYNVLLMKFSDSPTAQITTSSIVGNCYFNKTTSRRVQTLTLTGTAYSLRVLTAASMEGSSGYSGSMTMIQIETGETVTEYIQPISAIDAVVREDLDKTDLALSKETEAREFTDDFIKEVTSETRNVWQNGDVEITSGGERDGYTQFVLNKPITAGMYTISGNAISTNTNYNALLIHFSSSKTAQIDASTYVGTVHFKKTNDRYAQKLILSGTAYSVRVLTASSMDGSSGYSGSLTGIQIEAGEQETRYIEPFTAVDRIAREHQQDFGFVYTDFIPGYIDVSETTANINNVQQRDNWFHTIIPCKMGDLFKFECLGGSKYRNRYTFCDSSGTILKKSGIITESYNNWTKFDPDEVVDAPEASAYVIAHHYNNNAPYTPKVYKIADRGNIPLPHSQSPDWKKYVIAVYNSMIAILQDGIAKLSKDCGQTWNDGVDVSEIDGIVRGYLFANGNLAIYTMNKAYYIEDWESYDEAEYYEADGTTQYVPAEDGEDFYTHWAYSERKFLNGNDMYVFGNYHLEDDQRSLIWCTFDCGRTYRIAFEFGSRETQTPSGSWQIRHVHSVFYYEPEDVYIVQTGDSNATECMVFSLTYNSESGTWACIKLGGPARAYKWTSFAVWNNEDLYYTNDNCYGSVWKCKYNDIGDLSKHELVYEGMYNDALFVCASKNGELIVINDNVRNTEGHPELYPSSYTTDEGQRVFYYSSDRKNFSELHAPVAFLRGDNGFKLFIPIAADGQLFMTVRNDSDFVTMCVSDLLHEAGFTNAFLPRL